MSPRNVAVYQHPSNLILSRNYCIIGVGILATIDLLHGMAAIFYMHTFYVSNLQALLNVIEYQVGFFRQVCDVVHNG